MANLGPSNPPPVAVINNDLPFERYSEAVRQLRPLFPPACPSFEPGEVTTIGDTPIAAGGFADVWQGTCNGEGIIQKSYRCYQTDCKVEPIFQRYRNEVWVLSQLYHPNVVRLLGINPTPNHPFTLILDTGGNRGLREYLSEHLEADKLGLVLGVVRGLKHVHDQGIVHGHLVPNIVVDPDVTPRIMNFGSSLMISRPDLCSESDSPSFFRGIAPELIRPLTEHGKNRVVNITKASDMYAFGMLTWQIFSGMDPFFEDIDAAVIHRVLKGDRPSRPCHPGLYDRVWKMVEACWHDHPSRRPTAGQVVALIEAEPVLKRPTQLFASRHKSRPLRFCHATFDYPLSSMQN